MEVCLDFVLAKRFRRMRVGHFLSDTFLYEKEDVNVSADGAQK